jgi:hypothetical protein
MTPRFPVWLEEVTGLGFSGLAELWRHVEERHPLRRLGRARIEFVNRFQPVRLIGYHFDATRWSVIGEHSCAAHRRASG